MQQSEKEGLVYIRKAQHKAKKKANVELDKVMLSNMAIRPNLQTD